MVKAGSSSSQGLSGFNREVMSQVQRSNRAALDSLGMLVERGRIDKDEYTSKEIYHDTVVVIAKVKNIDLTKSENFIEDIRKMQDEYRAKQKDYTLHTQANNTHAIGNNLTNTDKKEELIQNLIRDTSVLHQLQLGLNKLTKTHMSHIEQTARAEVNKMKSFADSDKEHKSALVLTFNSTIATLQNDKREAKSLDEVVKVIVQGQEYLLGIGNQQPRHTSERIRELVVGAEENDRNNSIKKLKQELLANIKHGIIKNEQLKEIVSDNDVMKATEILTGHANSNRNRYLTAFNREVMFIEKTGEIDRDHLTSLLKDMDIAQRITHMKEVTAQAIDKHIMPQVNAIELEKQKANTLDELLIARQKEYGIYSSFGKDHLLAFAKYSEVRGDNKLFAHTEAAKGVDFKLLSKNIEQLLSREILTQEKVYHDLREHNEPIKEIHKKYQEYLDHDENHNSIEPFNSMNHHQQNSQVNNQDDSSKKLYLNLKIDM